MAKERRKGMERGAREKAMWLLRAAADILEAEAEEMILPGWDEGVEAQSPFDADHAARCAGVREAARAVAADGKTCDQGSEVRLYNLGYLVRYVGDILEE